jgi:hypothetical protein
MSETTTTPNPFTLATRKKLRFTPGQLSTEDLWDLPLEKLDQMAVAIDAARAKSKTFLEDEEGLPVERKTDDALRLEVILEVMRTRQAENKAKREAKAAAAQLTFLEGLLEKKKMAALESLPVGDIEAQIAALKG